MSCGEQRLIVHVNPERAGPQSNRALAYLLSSIIGCVVLVTLLVLFTREPGSSAERYLSQGYECQESGDYDGAVVQYRRALLQKQDSPAAHFLMGLAYLHIGGETDSMSDFVDLARTGDTSALDSADRCFGSAVQYGQALSQGEQIRAGSLELGTRDTFLADAYGWLGYTAMIRVAACENNRQYEYARQWVVRARQHFGASVQLDPANKMARAGLEALSGYRY